MTDQYSSGAQRSLTWDDRGRLATDTMRKVGGAVATSTTYGYDNNDNVTSQQIVAAGNPSAGTHSYTYDGADRLVSWSNQRGTRTTYAYDGAGNRTRAGTAIYTYDARNRMRTGGGAIYTWNERGDLTAQVGGSAGLLRYTYDGLDRLTKVTKGLQSVAYTYDGLNRVASRGTAAFAYNGLGLDPVSDGSSLFARSASGGLVSQSAAGVSSLVGTNRHGDVTGLFASDGSPTGTRVFDPLGNVVGSSGSASSSLGFQGDFTDAASGGVWMGARWYNPATGVFSVRDSVRGEVSSPGSFNGYGYGWDNPLSMSDPDGHWPGFLDNIVNAVSSWGRSVFAAVSSAVISHTMARVNSALAQVTKFLSKVADLTGISSLIDDVVRDPGAGLLQGLKFAAPILVGVGVSVGCSVATGGVGTPACLVLGGAAGGAFGAAMECSKMSASGCLRSVMVGAATGAAGGLFGGPVGGRIASTLLGRVASQAITGSLGAGAASITGQLLATGSVDWRRVGGDMLLGGALGAAGGVLGGKAARPSTRVAAAGEAGAASGVTGRSALGEIRVAAQPRGSVWSRVSGWARKVLGGGCNSFTGDTPVLMADGSKKPIRKVRLGDKVMAADPVTGVEGPRKVVDLIRHSGVHVMVAVHLSDGGVLNATDHHRFWVANRQAWVDAIDLKAGDQVVDRDGDQVVVAGVGISEQDLTAYNLTVAGLHTYFVGKANILVHNQGEACPIAAESADDVAQVTKNRIAGNEFRDLVATRLEAEEGFTVLQKEFGVRTPFGWRYIDILAQRNGGLINFETKLGKSRYLLSQRVKDWWISRVGADVYGDGTLTKIPAVLIRGPLN
ncbi:MAG: hypothetical protein KJ817_03290 [Actinobacteria bacterium]|nr:hypothetical protein [Actinomycetota bacterium]MBU4207495.1 hypothetical protein [Actinomycetota bacterium]